MSKTDSLYELIASLNSTEKRLFKMYVTTNSGGKEKAYLDLFNAYCKLNSCSESALRQKLPKTYPVKNLGQQKKYLKDLIMKCMRDIDDNRVEDSINELMREYVFLGKKNLVKEQWKKLQKAKELAQKFELPSRVLEILDHEMGFLVEHDFDKSLKFREHYEQERKQTLDWINQYHHLITTKNHLFQLLRRFRKSIDDENLKKADNLVAALDTERILSFQSFKILRLYNNSMAIHADLHQNKEDILKYRSQLIGLYKQFPWTVEKRKNNFIIDRFNYISSLFVTEKFDEMKVQLDELESVKLTNENDKGEFFQNITLNKILYWLNTRNLDEAAKAEADIIKGLHQFRNKINASSLLTLYFNYAFSFFCNDKFEECIDWLERIGEIKEEVRQDLKILAKIFIILCHFELGNHLLIESLVRSLRRKEKLHSAHAKILSSVLSLSKATAGAEKEILSSLDEMLKGSNSFAGKNLTSLWVNSKVNAQTIKETYMLSL